MKQGKTNFARALDYLRANGFVHNQKGLADRIGSTPTTVSRNKHGAVGRSDEETIAKFNAVFGDIINVAYLRGESDKMLVADLTEQEKLNMGVKTSVPAVPSDIDTPASSSLANAALAAKDETIASLKHELAAKDDIITILREQLSEHTELMRSIRQESAGLASKYESLLAEHNNLLHRINVNIDTINGGYLSIAADPVTPYGKK